MVRHAAPHAPNGGAAILPWHPSMPNIMPLNCLLPQRLYSFSAAQHGISDAQAAEIATVFSAFDSDENGYLSLDEFQQLWCVSSCC